MGIGAGSCVEGARVVRLLQPVLPHSPEDGLTEMEVAPVGLSPVDAVLVLKDSALGR